MAKTRKPAIDPADALQARATEDPALAAILDALVSRVRLWRLCVRSECKRARECRGGAAACRAWRAHRSVAQSADAGSAAAGAKKIVFQWRDPKDAKA
jgi:hypothetical protein